MEREYVRSLHCNYERLLLEEKPEENRFQYCMVSRGGIRGLLACSLRYLNGNAYLYYDITSKQNVAQLFQKAPIGREWLLDFMDSVKHLRQELDRFLLQDSGILWDPDQIFQDFEKNDFSFIYVPYNNSENRFLGMLGFLVEHIDYEDDELVECVYRMYEQMEKNGEIYLQERIFEDVKRLETKNGNKDIPLDRAEDTEGNASVEIKADTINAAGDRKARVQPDTRTSENRKRPEKDAMTENRKRSERDVLSDSDTQFSEKDFEEKDSLGKDSLEKEESSGKKGWLSLFETRKNKSREQKNSYRESMLRKMEGYAVAEEDLYAEEEDNHTVFLDMPKSERQVLRRLYTPDGKILAQINSNSLLLGKAGERVDVVLEDPSVSRLHAKVIRNRDEISLEDLNSTNGTFLNGDRLQPYEKRRMEPGDQIQCGTVILQYQ